MKQHYIVGCGGVGSWLLPRLIRLLPIEQQVDAAIMYTLIDGDILEERNMDRQLFNDSRYIGGSKSASLADLYRASNAPISFLSVYFSETLAQNMGIRENDWIWCCADNHACRRAVLNVCDSRGCRAIIGANEYTDAEAYFYQSGYRNTPNDPRVFYPDILTDNTGDPLAPQGCTGEAAEAAPQLVLANDMAGALMLQLYWFHEFKKPDLDAETRPMWPIHLKSNEYKLQTIRLGDRR